MIRLDNILFQYPQSGYRIAVPEMAVEANTSAVIVGPSGSGKTTLLHLIAGILKPTSGTLQVDDITLSSLNEAECRDFRIRKVGMVFQEFELIEYLNVLENVLLPFRINPIQTVSEAVKQRADGITFHCRIGRLSQPTRDAIVSGRTSASRHLPSTGYGTTLAAR